MAFLVSRGYSWAELTDVKNGPPLDTLLGLKIEASKLALEEHRRSVEAVSLGVGGLLSKELLPDFFKKVDEIIDKIDEAQGDEGKTQEARKQTSAERSVRNLGALNKLLGGVPAKG